MHYTKSFIETKATPAFPNDCENDHIVIEDNIPHIIEPFAMVTEDLQREEDNDMDLLENTGEVLNAAIDENLLEKENRLLNEFQEEFSCPKLPESITGAAELEVEFCEESNRKEKEIF